MTLSPTIIRPGDVIAEQYEVKELLGRGGMGEVYRAHYRLAKFDVAIKCPLPDRFETDEDVRRFIAEADRWMDLGSHVNILTCYHVRRINGVPAIVAEYVDGGSLSEWIASRQLYAPSLRALQTSISPDHQSASLERILDISIQIAQGLLYAHSRNVIHQDVKPQNVLMTSDGIAKVADFGLAQVGSIESGTVEAKHAGMLSRPYASPEQLSGLPVKRSADIWCWAATVLEMFAGGLFWQAGADYALEMYLESPPAEFDLPPMPPELATLLRNCLEPKERARPRAFGEVIRTLLSIYRTYVESEYKRAVNTHEDGVSAPVSAHAPEPPSEVQQLRATASSGDVAAQLRLGQILRDGAGVDQDFGEAYDWLSKAADGGSRDAQYLVGLMWDQGEGRRRTPAEAARRYAQAASQGHPDAQYNLAWMLEKGEGVPADLRRAVDLYRSAAEGGHLDAQSSMAMLYRNGRGVKKDAAEALKWFIKAAEQGDVVAQTELGKIYSAGEGTAADYAEAARWFFKAAERKEVVAVYSLGVMFANGLGVRKNDVEAVRWLQEAAELGHIDAMNRLWYHYATGAGVKRDEPAAMTWLTKAAERGSRDAQNQLGFSYEIGEGVPRDFQQALSWYEKAAKQGSVAAKFNLGRFLVEGIATKPQRSDGLIWLEQAAQVGHKEAAEYLAKIRRPTEREEVPKRVEPPPTAPAPAPKLGQPLPKTPAARLDVRPPLPKQDVKIPAPKPDAIPPTAPDLHQAPPANEPPKRSALKWEWQPEVKAASPAPARTPEAGSSASPASPSTPLDLSAVADDLGPLVGEYAATVALRQVAMGLGIVFAVASLATIGAGIREGIAGCNVFFLVAVAMPLIAYSFFNRMRSLYVFERGAVLRRSATKIDVARWSDSALHRSWRSERRDGPLWTLKPSSGKPIRIDSRLKDYMAAGELVSKLFNEARYPAFVRGFDGGETLPFGPIALSRDTLTVRQSSLPLADLQHAGVVRTKLSFQKRNSYLPWASVFIAHIPNFDLLYGLLHRSGKLK